MTIEQLNEKVKAIEYILENKLISEDMFEEAQIDLDFYRVLKEDAILQEQENQTDDFDDITEPQVHPLISEHSRHYEMVDSVEAIIRMEQMYTPEQLMNWSLLSAMKYRLRIGHKDDVQKEASKIAGFEAYYKYLESK
jgi:hypothetical protein